MTEYLHHVPGRLRLRARVFRFESPSRNAALRKLRDLEGVRSVRLNAKAASVTVYYDTTVTEPQAIIDFLSTQCVPATPVQGPGAAAAKTAAPGGPNLAAEIGRMALSVLVNKGVSYSISSLLGGRLGVRI